uniref:uncharacterized protein LOC122601330 n=1 Tax=Erigeron canadensis TaxID=72917 RepID=UPI001CB98C74|nr:uncharacterized protein LOC122601330 [Erigeron canadensis]
MSSYVDNGSSTRPPMFDKDDFSGWKGRMSLLLESMDNNMPDILTDGPYIPKQTLVVDAVVRDGQPTIPATIKTIVKDRADWGDEDRRLANLDVKARNFIVQVVPKDIYHSIKMYFTTKKMWGTLTVMFEGCPTSMESTITTLTRRYERFFSLRNESSTDTHTRFNSLVNNLAAVGITKKNEVLKRKFLDSLPPKWNNYISSVKLSSVYHDLDLPGLFGLLHNQECSEVKKLIAMGDSYSLPPTALVASMTEHPSSISNEIIPCVNRSVPVISNTNSVCSESECDESDGEEIANEVAMLADRIRRSFGKFKGKGKSGQADKTKKSYDMSKVTCYKCGKTGHMAGDCRSKESLQAMSSKGGRSVKYSKLKTKYKDLKAQVVELSKKIEKDEKNLIAKDWAESATSSEDEVYTDEKCLMAKEKFVEDLIKLQEQAESAHKASTSQTTPPEVTIFSDLYDNEKLSRLNRLGDDVLLQKHFNQELKKEISILKQQISSKNFTIEKLESEVKAQKQLNSILVKEAKTSEEKFLKIKHITESWYTNSKRAAKCVNVQVPHQVQAIFDGEYDRAIAIREVCAMEPCYQPPSPPKIQSKGKNSKPIRVIKLKPEETLDMSKLTITQSVSSPKSKTKNNVSKRNKRKIRDQSVPKGKSKLLKNEKSGSKGNVSPTKSVSSSNHLEFDYDKMISKYVESRKGKISDDKKLLVKVSDPNVVDQSKLRSECKKSGNGKGFAQKETLNVAKKNFKSGKGQIKQQWVSKCDKNVSSVSQSESDPMGYHDAHTWHLDSGCSKHMTGCKSLLCNFRTSAGPSVIFGDESQGRTEGFGILSNGPLIFRWVSYVNGLKHNLISVSQLCDAGYEVRFRADKGIVLDLEGNVVLIAERDDSLYSFDMRSATRLSHMNFKDINKLCKKELVSGLPVIKYEKDKTCGPCEKGKQHKASFKSKTCSTIDSCLDLLHMDLFGPISTPSFIGMSEKGISQVYSAARTPQQNGIAERRNRTLIEASISMMAQNNVKPHFWAEAIHIACFTQNRSLIVKRHQKTAYELLRGRKLEIGCSKPVDAHPEDENINLEELVFPENEPPSNPPIEDKNAQTPGEQIIEEEELPFFDCEQADPTPTQENIQNSLNDSQADSDPVLVKADLHVPQVDQAGPSNLNQPIVQETNPAQHVTKWTRSHPINQIIGDPLSGVKTKRKATGNFCMFVNFVSKMERTEIDETLADPSWVNAMQDELTQFERNKVWKLLPIPHHKTVIGTKWVYRNKMDERGVVTRNKARLVVLGYRQ